jgi:hypothetical protein
MGTKKEDGRNTQGDGKRKRDDRIDPPWRRFVPHVVAVVVLVFTPSCAVLRALRALCGERC